MSRYRWAVLKYPDGSKARVIVEEHEVYADLITLWRNHGIRFRVGPPASKEVAAAFTALKRREGGRAERGISPRPLSADFGRGSGGPI
jgi:hypothetical protein